MSKVLLEKLRNKSEKENIKQKLYKEYEMFKVSNLYNETDLLKSISNVISSILSLLEIKEQIQIFHRKNILMFIATIFGVLGSLVFKFPEDKVFILLCVGGFFSLMFGTFLVDFYSPFPGFSNSYILNNISENNIGNLIKNIWFYNEHACYIIPKIDRNSNNIEFLIQKNKSKVFKTTYLGQLFTSDGYINTNEIFDIISNLIVELNDVSQKKL